MQGCRDYVLTSPTRHSRIHAFTVLTGCFPGVIVWLQRLFCKSSVPYFLSIWHFEAMFNITVSCFVSSQLQGTHTALNNPEIRCKSVATVSCFLCCTHSETLHPYREFTELRIRWLMMAWWSGAVPFLVFQVMRNNSGDFKPPVCILEGVAFGIYCNDLILWCTAVTLNIYFVPRSNRQVYK